MGNTSFYKNINKENNITSKDIFSESFKKHSKAELDHALAAGTSVNTATEQDMLSKWSKPWIWFRAAKIGLLLVAIIYIIFFATIYISSAISNASWIITIIIPPMIFPLIILVFIWELNIPKNISLMECFLWVVIGGLLSMSITVIISRALQSALNVNDLPAEWAAFTEEPGKLFTSIIILAIIRRKKKIYGITGLVIGACVGAGFGGFESISYAMSASNDGMILAIENQLLRGVYSLGGHVLYCAPYTAAIAYKMKDSKFNALCFTSSEFIMTFLFSVAMHYCWNSSFFSMMPSAVSNIRYWTIIVLLWMMLLWIVKKCLRQVVAIGRHSASRATAAAHLYHLTLVCMSGVLRGMKWYSTDTNNIRMGRDRSNTAVFPKDTKGVSRQHCSISCSGGQWYIRDLNSSYGTYVNNVKLAPQTPYLLHPNDIIALAGNKNTFKVVMKEV